VRLVGPCHRQNAQDAGARASILAVVGDTQLAPVAAAADTESAVRALHAVGWDEIGMSQCVNVPMPHLCLTKRNPMTVSMHENMLERRDRDRESARRRQVEQIGSQGSEVPTRLTRLVQRAPRKLPIIGPSSAALWPYCRARLESCRWCRAPANRPTLLAAEAADMFGHLSYGVNDLDRLAFDAPSRKAVDAFHVAALIAGGTDCGAPGLRPQYSAVM
jgi:hypothetical protein